jgi:hypothetical protein
VPAEEANHQRPIAQQVGVLDPHAILIEQGEDRRAVADFQRGVFNPGSLQLGCGAVCQLDCLARSVVRRGRVWLCQCFRSFHTAERTLEGIESLHMMRKGRVKRLDGRDAAGQADFIASLFGVAA